MTNKFKMDDYIDVAARIVEFREKHPEGCLRPLNADKPYEIVTVQDATFVVVVAAAYRTPNDPSPGVGMAWEPFPGPTPYTKNSELQNAETSAWGRALVAVLAADTKRGIASKQEVESRKADDDLQNAKRALWAKARDLGMTKEDLVGFAGAHGFILDDIDLEGCAYLELHIIERSVGGGGSSGEAPVPTSSEANA